MFILWGEVENCSFLLSIQTQINFALYFLDQNSFLVDHTITLALTNNSSEIVSAICIPQCTTWFFACHNTMELYIRFMILKEASQIPNPRKSTAMNFLILFLITEFPGDMMSLS